MRALVVDDNPINQKIAQFNLKQLDIESDLAANGLEAIDLYKQNTYSLILMDIQMPIMDGLDATKEIRKIERDEDYNQTAFIVALTANTFDDENKQCLDAGMNAFIEKPITEQALRNVINQL